MEKVLISGASGFIGRNLCAYLKSKGYYIRALCRQPFDYAGLADELVLGDIRQAESLGGICDGIQTVFHAAGYAHAHHHPKAANLHREINLIGTQTLFREAKRAQVAAFIFISSVKAEDAANKLDKTPYAQAKLGAERFLLAEARTNIKPHISILRPALVYGPGWKGNLATMLRAIDKGRFPTLPDTQNKRSLVSVHDVARAALMLSQRPKAHGKVYTVTDGKRYSTHQLYTLMANACGRKASRLYLPYFVLATCARLGDVFAFLSRKSMPFDSDKLDKLLGSAYYSDEAIRHDLGFQSEDLLENSLPTIIAQCRQS